MEVREASFVAQVLPAELAATVGAQQDLTTRFDEMEDAQQQLGAKIRAIDGEIVFATKAAMSSVEHTKKVSLPSLPFPSPPLPF